MNKSFYNLIRFCFQTVPIRLEPFVFISSLVRKINTNSLTYKSILLQWIGTKGGDIQTGTFSLEQMRAATNDFSSDNKIGEGGFGPVYKVFG